MLFKTSDVPPHIFIFTIKEGGKVRKKSTVDIKEVILHFVKSPLLFMILLNYLELNLINSILVGLYIFYLIQKDSDFNSGWHSQYERSIAF